VTIPVITAPDPTPDGLSGVTVFLAGGISGCADWQQMLIAKLTGTMVTAVNPRRPYGIAMEGPEAVDQIAWERRWLMHPHQIDIISFWFPEETLCPITLLELGKALMLPKDVRVVVGCHPNYQRRFDVIEQCKERPEITVVDTLHDLAGEIRAAAFQAQAEASSDLSVCCNSIGVHMQAGRPQPDFDLDKGSNGLLSFRDWYEAWSNAYGGEALSERTERICGLTGSTPVGLGMHEPELDIAAQELI